ncbi:MAG TPA: sensor histidine kinase, partial [Candidatus Binatia bacterium]
MPLVAKPKIRRFKLRSILLAVSLVVLILPLGGIYFLRIYENELVKQTELELISQAALISAVYKREVQILTAGERRQDYGMKISPPSVVDDYYRPIKAALNLTASEIRPRPGEPQKTDLHADSVAMEAGSRLSSMLLEAQRTTLSGVRILDHQGLAVGGRADIGLSFAHLEEVQRARSGIYTSSIRERTIHRPTRAFASISRGTGIRVFVAFPIREDDRLLGVILLSRTPQSILEHLYEQKERVLVLAGVVLLLAAASVVLTSYTIARPLHALIQQTKQFATGDKKPIEPLKSPVTEEVALLSESFAEMARSLEYRAQYIRNFAGHVSHEFKTPLTGIQGA